MNNEEKILELLEKQGQILEKHGAMLEKQGQILEKHGAMLEKHGAMLEKHGTMLEKHGTMLESLTEKVEEIDQRSLQTAIVMENTVIPKLQLLYEGHETIMEKLKDLTPKSRVEVLEDTVDMLKDVIRAMRQDIAELKKAQ